MMYLDVRAVRERANEVFGENRFLPWEAWPVPGDGEPDWSALNTIDVVHVVDDPFIWRGLVIRSQRGDKRAYRELLTQFGNALELMFERILPRDQVEEAVHTALSTIHAKRHTCDPKTSILSWLMALSIETATRHFKPSSVEFELR